LHRRKSAIRNKVSALRSEVREAILDKKTETARGLPVGLILNDGSAIFARSRTRKKTIVLARGAGFRKLEKKSSPIRESGGRRAERQRKRRREREIVFAVVNSRSSSSRMKTVREESFSRPGGILASRCRRTASEMKGKQDGVIPSPFAQPRSFITFVVHPIVSFSGRVLPRILPRTRRTNVEHRANI